MKPSCCDPFAAKNGFQRDGCAQAGDAVARRWRFAGARSESAAAVRRRHGFPWNQKRDPGVRILNVEARCRRRTPRARKRFIERLRE